MVLWLFGWERELLKDLMNVAKFLLWMATYHVGRENLQNK